MHVLICGRTSSGKSTLAKQLTRNYAAMGVNTLILDPLEDPGWSVAGADFITSDPVIFREIAQINRKCMIILDESGETVGRYNEEMFFFATRARHYGHMSHFITQRPAQLAPTVRDQCTTLFLFACSVRDAKILSDEFGTPQIANAYELNKFEFYRVPRFGSCEKLLLTL